MNFLQRLTQLANLMAATTVISLLIATSAEATMAYRIATIVSIESEAANRPGYQSLMYVYQVGAWSTSVSCDPQWAFFNAKDNPHFVAVLLAAKLSERTVKVYVDDSMPKTGNICQVVNVGVT